MTEPTDNELDIVLSKHWPAFATMGTLPLIWTRAAFREAIAKWGTPPAVAGEPVAWRYVDARGHFRYVGYKPSRDMAAEYPLLKPIRLYPHPSPPDGMAGGWTALPGALPEPGVPVLLDIGKKYPIRAMWAAKHTVQACDDDTDWGEYVEEDDMYYAPEGWYEWNQCEDNHWRVTETPRAWAPLPPTTSAGSGKGE